jgi:signal peptidase I
MQDEPNKAVVPTAPEMSSSKKTKRSERLRAILTTAAIVVAAPLVAILLTAFVFQSYEVDGPSMQTTLHNNDRLIVSKVARTWSRITGHQYVPKRGDIVIFVGGPALTAFGQDANRQLIKRVVALPGEKVQVANGKLIVYNKAHPKGFDPDDTLSYGKAIGDTEPMNTNGIITLGPNQIFVCGDNRPDSLDSRSFGPVNVNQIVGTLAARVLPLSSAERF